MTVTAPEFRRPIGLIKDFWDKGGVLGLATGKKKMLSFYVSHGYPEDQMTIYDPEKLVPEPDEFSSARSALHKLKVALNAPAMEGKATAWMGVDVLTATSYTNPFDPRKDVDWDYHLKAERMLDHRLPGNNAILEQELIERYHREFWTLWEMTWALGLAGNAVSAWMTLSFVGHYPHGLPENVIRRSMKKNPELAYKIGPGVDLASQYSRHGCKESSAKCVSCCGGEMDEFENKKISAAGLVNLVVFRYLTQHQMAKGLMVQFERQ